MRKFITRRFVFAMICMAIATALLLMGKLSGENWCYALGIVTVGHHAEGCVAAAKATPAREPPPPVVACDDDKTPPPIR